MEHKCETCSLRSKYEKAPKSLIGRLWRWHTQFCPGWKAYFSSLEREEQTRIKKQYNLK